jgi:Ca2+-binding EF-hand superfamily protein
MRRRMGLVAALAGGMTVFAPARVSADDSAKTGVGPIKSIQDLQDTAKMLFKLADTNNDGQISQKEATDAGNLLVGGFFFRADANGDGTLTREEAQQARENLFQQQPLLRLVLQKAKPTDVAAQPNAAQPNAVRPTPSTADPATTAKQIAVNPEGTIGSLLDANHDQKIEATEVRQAVQTGVQALFTFCDTNQDAQLTPYELNAAVGEAAKSAVQTVFQAADMDRNGQLSVEEYDKALAEPAHALFRVIDADNNNNLSLAEIQRAEQILADQIMRLRVPEPPNSISNAVKQSANSTTAAPTQTQAASLPNPR